MTIEQIKENLCEYDVRSPYYDQSMEDYKKEDCMCNNCFYGRTELANELLKMIKL